MSQDALTGTDASARAASSAEAAASTAAPAAHAGMSRTPSALSRAILEDGARRLPLRPEHFVSDIHGDAPAFDHLVRSRSGEVRRLVSAALQGTGSKDAIDRLMALIYYPELVVERAHAKQLDTRSWWHDKMGSLAMLAGILERDLPTLDVDGRAVVSLANLHAAPVAHAAAPAAHAGAPSSPDSAHLTMQEGMALRALVSWGTTRQGADAFGAAVDALVASGEAPRAIAELAGWVRRLCSGPLHVVGDLWDRGPRGDLVVRTLMALPEVDVQWGNHDICWMGAAAGDPACIATVLRNNLKYGNVEQFEQGYGIDLAPLRDFAAATYSDEGEGLLSPVLKAIGVLLFKCEGQAIRRHPEWHMEGRLLLGRIDREAGTVDLPGRGAYPISTRDFPTVDLAPGGDAYAFTAAEAQVMDALAARFTGSEELRRQIQWIYDLGRAYQVVPGTPADGQSPARGGYLLIHGCVPLAEDGSLAQVDCGDRTRSGRELLDWTDLVCRRAWERRDQSDLDWMGFFWTGWQSTFMGRVVKTFERTYIADKSTWEEPEDPYYALTREDPAPCRAILEEFGCDPDRDVIVNGHTPVKLPKGQAPVRGGGKRLVIDGGFCKAYRKSTGIAGYTLVDDADGVRLIAHGEFPGLEEALAYQDMDHTPEWLERR